MMIKILLLVGLSVGILLTFVYAKECNEDEYQCLDGVTCVFKGYMCNSRQDCPGGDDESHEWCDVTKCREKDSKFFMCSNNRTCISKELTCNNLPDCEDASDESDFLCDSVPDHTTHRPCNAETELECDFKVCLKKEFVCDGRKDCNDGKDEDVETCKGHNVTCHGFQCDNKQCLDSMFLHCDGNFDCKDGSDERNCDCELSKGKFLCHSDDECIDLKKLCDGHKDCTDGSDENESCTKAGCKSLKCDGTGMECAELPEGPTCICQHGFQFNRTTKKCDDVDECQIYGTCSQQCQNLNGSYRCICAPNFRLQSDNKTCNPIGGDPILVYNTRKQILAYYLTAEKKTMVQKTKQAIGVTYDGEFYYWTDITDNRESIIRYNEATNQKETVVGSGLQLPEDIAVDWLTKNIYFTDADFAHIVVCTSNGSDCTVLIQTKEMMQPRGIALYPPEALLLWTDWGLSSHIGIAWMDGSDARHLVEKVTWPNGLTIDWPSRRVFWADAFEHTLESVTINGHDRRTILKDRISHPYSVAVIGSTIYWSDWETESIKSCDKFTGKDLKMIASGSRFYDVHVYHESLMPSAKHACNPSPCSHICLLSANLTATCACPENLVLDNSGRSCRESREKFDVIIGVESSLFVIPNKRFGRKNVRHIELEKHNDAMAFNTRNGEVFIADSYHNQIYSVDLETEKSSTIVEGAIGTTSLAYDYLANNLYWVDENRGTVEVFSLDKKKRAILIHEKGDERPHALTLMPTKGEMFIAMRHDDHYHIDRHSMTGGDEHFHVIESNLTGPIHLDADENAEKLYWVDRGGMKIEWSDFNGNSRKDIATSESKMMATAAVVGEEIYWTALKSKSIQWREKDGSGMINQQRISLIDKTDDYLKVIARAPLKISKHPCMMDNGGCSDICISNGSQSRICICEIGHFFKDSTNTTCTSPDCDFKCVASPDQCVAKSQKCDGKWDCIDGSDENECEKLKLSADNQMQSKSDNESSSSLSSWLWTLFILILIGGFSYAGFIVWQRYHSFKMPNISMHFRNNQLFGLSQGDKSALTTVTTSPTSQPSSLVRTINRNSHEIVNDDYLSLACSLNMPNDDHSSVVGNYLEDCNETENVQDFPTLGDQERLIK